MKRTILQTTCLGAISWLGNDIVDWAMAGTLYKMTGEKSSLYTAHYVSDWDGGITSQDRKYAFIYQRLGTKGLLLKNGNVIREINRAWYCSDVYEYPAAFITLEGKTILIHCPTEYNCIDFEDVETGKLITKTRGRKPDDVFHSRLEVSPDNNFLISRGWVWHPADVVNVFDIRECLKKPKLLDKATLIPNVGTAVSTASFMNSRSVLIGASDEVYFRDKIGTLPPKSIAVWDLRTNQILQAVKIKGEFGNLFSINEDLVWDLYRYPKIINIKTGEIVDKEKSIDSGNQCSSIIHRLDNNIPQIIFNRETKQIAITGKERIEVLTPELSY